ncbi:hypothetical protein FSP39_011821 [Pinctada imbricata]|uniref:Sulfotransferase domain-containing protein n=1 Tax=Pinctada imbricata TaxID=66713 RepID=A0AA89BVS2_PINIB|nr:hypothetical protein FSP39_011821 [Pinctada imbricata]
MDSEHYFRKGRFQKQYGDVEFDFITIDGIGLNEFEVSPGGHTKRIKDIINLECRPDDVLLATYPKCGTHWTNEILHMVLQRSANYMKETKLGAMLEVLPSLDTLDRLQSPRVLNTHLPYKWLPRKHIQNGGKIIHTTRNPKDTYVSYFHHCKNLLELGNKSKNMTWAQFFDTCVIGKDVVYGSWFDYEKEIDLAKKSNKNIYTVYFENLKEDPEREIKGIVTFLDIQLPDSLIKEIAQKCEFQNLKKADKEFKEDPPEIKGMLEEFQMLFPDVKVDMYRKGIVGDWKNYFTIAQNEQFDALVEKELKDTSVKAIF